METKVVGINRAVRAVEAIIFNIRWILPLFYMGLVVVMFLYGYSYAEEIFHLCREGFLGEGPIKLDEMKLISLDMVDVVMIANLVKMIIAGSYHSFISKHHGYRNEAISSGALKIKISTSIIVVASIHLLKQFVTHTTWDVLLQELATFGAFLLSALVLGALEFLHVKGESIESETEARHAAAHSPHAGTTNPPGNASRTPSKPAAHAHPGSDSQPDHQDNKHEDHAHA
jgi:uncharacterized protein (TIGR00645 family)